MRRQVMGDLAILGLGRADGRCTGAVQAGIERLQLRFDGAQLGEIGDHDLREFRIRLPAGLAPKRGDVGHVRRTQAFAQHALPDQSGGTCNQDAHGNTSVRRDRQRSACRCPCACSRLPLPQPAAGTCRMLRKRHDRSRQPAADSARKALARRLLRWRLRGVRMGGLRRCLAALPGGAGGVEGERRCISVSVCRDRRRDAGLKDARTQPPEPWGLGPVTHPGKVPAAHGGQARPPPRSVRRA